MKGALCYWYRWTHGYQVPSCHLDGSSTPGRHHCCSAHDFWVPTSPLHSSPQRDNDSGQVADFLRAVALCGCPLFSLDRWGCLADARVWCWGHEWPSAQPFTTNPRFQHLVSCWSPALSKPVEGYGPEGEEKGISQGWLCCIISTTHLMRTFLSLLLARPLTQPLPLPLWPNTHLQGWWPHSTVVPSGGNQGWSLTSCPQRCSFPRSWLRRLSFDKQWA